MPPITLHPAGKRCRCGARRDKTARKCRKCEARSRYRRSTHYRKAAQRRTRLFQPRHNQRKDMPS
jgi:ribosomal protein L40E